MQSNLESIDLNRKKKQCSYLVKAVIFKNLQVRNKLGSNGAARSFFRVSLTTEDKVKVHRILTTNTFSNLIFENNSNQDKSECFSQ